MTPAELKEIVSAAEGLEADGGFRIGYEANVDIAGEGWERPKEIQVLVDLAPSLAALLADAMEFISEENDIDGVCGNPDCTCCSLLERFAEMKA